MSEALRTEKEKITALRDAIMLGFVKETDDCLRGVNVIFPVEENAKDIFLREFYGTFLKYFLESVIPDINCPGMVCRGPPGVGKVLFFHTGIESYLIVFFVNQSYMAMYFLFKLLLEGYTVVYEQVLTEKVFVIPPTGDCRVFFGKATSDVVSEFYGPKTAHLFDACAGTNNREPIKNPSKVIIFTSPNFNSYKQIQRLGAIMLTVPSYSLVEMNNRRTSFPHVTEDVYKHKLEMCGHGSIRLVLGLEMKRTEELLLEAVQNTTVRNMLEVVQNRDVDMVNGIRGPSSLFTTTLAKGADKTDIRSYAPHNVAWNISSGYIMNKLVAQCKDEAVLFAGRASDVFQRIPALEPTAGKFFEAVAPRWLAEGGKFKVRKLDGTGVEVEEEWSKLTVVDAANFTQLSDACVQCVDTNSMYLFMRKMEGIDAFNPPTKFLQCTVSKLHPVSLNSLVIINKHLPTGAKLLLYYVVPANRYDEGWHDEQSFSGPTKQRNAKKLLSMTDAEIEKIMRVNETNFNAVHSKLEQYVVRLDLNKPPVTPQKAGYLPTYDSIRTFSTMARDSNAVRGSVAGGMKALQRVLKMI